MNPTSQPRSHDLNQAVSSEFGIFGIPTTEEKALVVLLPVPWEVTTSYGVGASNGPQMIRDASVQIDLFDFETGKAYEQGYFMREIPEHLYKLSQTFKVKTQELQTLKENLSEDWARQDQLAQEINSACQTMTTWVYEQSQQILKSGKLLGVIGGDHSTPLGAIRALSEKYKGQFGILHIDAHADLRKAYQGLEQSHASIMYNVMNEKLPPAKLVQVGIRDFCEEEFEFSKNHPNIETFFDLNLKIRLFEGESWKSICEDIVSQLPQNVFISFDIDGLDPALCPHTGTPVPGGLSTDQVFYLFYTLKMSGRKIIGFDLNEVSSGDNEESEWDGNVGARILYKLCGWLATSHIK